MATTLMGLVTIGMMTIMQHQVVAVSYMEDKIEKIEAERLIRESMSDLTVCDSLFSGRIITADKTTLYDLAEIEDAAGTVMYTSNSDLRKLSIGQISFRNKSIDVIDSSGVITLIVPVSRLAEQGLRELKPIEINLFTSVDSSFEITSCAAALIPSIDPSGLERDGWLCTCNGDYTSTTEGGTTVCMLQIEGKVADMWVAPDPWTKATATNFTCAGGSAPNPPGSLPLLRWRYNNYSFVGERCNMIAGSMTTATSPPCP